MSDREDLPIFPLRTILFPDSKLPLRIFEPRYIDMVSRSMREDSEFGIILSRESTDPKMFETYDTGTLARIIDWDHHPPGLWGNYTYLPAVAFVAGIPGQSYTYNSVSYTHLTLPTKA